MKKVFFVFFSLTVNLLAEHGPLTTAYPLPTYRFISPNEKGWLFSQEIHFTSYQNFPKKDIPEALKSLPNSHMGQVESALLALAQISYGLLPNFSLRLELPYYYAFGVQEAFYDSGENFREVSLGSISGFSDFSLASKLDFWQNPNFRFSFLSSVKFPTGKTSDKSQRKPISAYLPQAKILAHIAESSPNANPLNDTYQIDPSLMPGSGSLDFSFGYLLQYQDSENEVLLNADFIRRGQAQDFRIGNLFLTQILYERLLVNKTPFLFFHFGVGYLLRGKNQYKKESFANSGGQYLFSQWGVRLKFTNFSVYLTSGLPFWQKLANPQQEVEMKGILGFSFNL